jgi:hypothetical protein
MKQARLKPQAGASQTLTCRAILMTLSWAMGAHLLYNATVSPRRYQVCCHDAKPRFAYHQNKLPRSKPSKNPAQMIGFMESVH